jgi:hypothetical protein
VATWDELRPSTIGLTRTEDGGPWHVVRLACPCGVRLAVVKPVWERTIHPQGAYCKACRSLGFGKPIRHC